MNRPHDNRTYEDPQHGRGSAPDNDVGRSHDWAGTGTGCEMMPENNLFFGGHIVAPIELRSTYLVTDLRRHPHLHCSGRRLDIYQ